MKKLIKITLQLIVLFVFNQLGIGIVDLLQLPLPGNVVGMVLLFICLWVGILKLDWIEGASSILIRHLAFFFIPISVGLMTLGTVFLENGFALMIAILISAFVGIVLSGISSQYFVKRGRGEGA